MSTYKAVIFDWAGTTVDYGCFAPVQAFVEVFCHFGIEPTMEEAERVKLLKGWHRAVRCALAWSQDED